MKRNIKKVAVLGSGIMGSRIACHFANAGMEVLLLDIPTPGVPELSSGQTTKEQRNALVNESLKKAVQSNPSPLYRKAYQNRITTGNFSDDLKNISDCDWVLEAIVEKLDVKQQLFEKVDAFRKPGSIVSTNTSGIPVHLIATGRSEDFRKNFCGTHFFNPPRYLRLLEIIPASDTSQELIDFLLEFGSHILGKETIVCNDTPAFIANRIGVFAIMSLLHLVEAEGWTVEDIDRLTGPILGRPKSATFRTTDVVGLDTMVHVANGLYEKCTDDPMRDVYKLPPFVKTMFDNKWLGDKTGQGFYKKAKDSQGKTEILSLNLKTLEYGPQSKSKFATLEQAKGIDDLATRTKTLFYGQDKAGEFYRKLFCKLFSYVSWRIPEVCSDIHSIDRALKAGFGWETGPFETWDAVGVREATKLIDSYGLTTAPWVKQMLESGVESFYQITQGQLKAYDMASQKHQQALGENDAISLNIIRGEKLVWKNSGSSLLDLGDGVLNLEFHTKMNSIGGEILEGINKSIEIAEKDFKGLVIANEGANFSAGANLALVFMFAVEQEYEELDFAIRAFQNTNMHVRYSSVPVVVAPHGLTLGGGCEMALHADSVVAAAETYTGLVEFGVGLIPGGGGTKEFVLRLSDAYEDGDMETNALRNRFLTIAMAKVSTSAHEAFDLGIFQDGKDRVVMNRNRLVYSAKKRVLELYDAGYTMPMRRKNIRVPGKSALGMVQAGANAMQAGHFMSKHDQLISEKLGFIMCGGDLSAPALVSEQYLLDLEREAFMSLCGEKKTLERIQSILTTGKPLRN
ncbi:MAG: 3-hydroxyacyl-CoA dehydrogenase NAD-binding domain-containing protein [Bacteroidota bacterium]|jgi:3-hydroxyacyl-CoA dehydrogenase